VDVSKFRTGDWLMVVGGAVMLVFGLVLDWASFGGTSGNNAFDYFFTGGIAWLLVVAAGVVAFLLAGGVMKPGTTPWPLILLLATGIATLLMLLRLILGGGEVSGGGIEADLDRAAGMYIAFVAAAVALVGAFLNFKASGGDVRSLTDADTYRTSFNRPGGGTPGAPPPPPPGAAGTPPPPPSAPPPPSV